MSGQNATMRRWFPSETTWVSRPEAGDLVAASHHVYRIIEVRDVPEVDYEPSDEPGCFYVTFQDIRGGRRRHHKRPAHGHFYVYPHGEHRPVCAECHEPWPCLHLDAKREARRQGERLDHLMSILPGCCWSCGEPITHRQGSVEFDGANAWLPTAPRARFHRRRKCISSAVAYERAWLDADPRRSPILTAPREDVTA